MQIKYMVAALCCASLMAGFAACGGDDDDDSAPAGPCEQFCPVAVDLGCPNSDDIETCEATCNTSLTLLPTDCQDELDAFVDCMENASGVECSSPLPLTADSCSSEGDAVLGCALGGGTGGTGNEGGSGNTAGSAATDAGAGGAN